MKSCKAGADSAHTARMTTREFQTIESCTIQQMEERCPVAGVWTGK